MSEKVSDAVGLLQCVSVVLPTCNRAFSLLEAVYSVLGQTHSALELIIVDDASTDDTRTLLEGVSDNRLRVIRLPQNTGAPHARNVGIEAARFDIIAFHDSDDIWLPEKLKTSLARMRKDSTDVVVSRFIDFDGVNVKVWPDLSIFPLDPKDVHGSQLRSGFFGTPASVMRKSLLQEVGGFQPDLPRYEDYELAVRLAKWGRFSFIQDPLLIARDFGEGITSNDAVRRGAFRKIYARHKDDIEKNRAARSVWRRKLGVGEMYDGSRSQAIRHFWNALLAAPHSPINMLNLVLSLSGSLFLFRAVRRLFRFLEPRHG